jgi:Flp pilus assembly pilin Flp
MPKKVMNPNWEANMTSMWRWWVKGFLAEADAASGVEYALLIGLIAMVIFSAVSTFGSTVYNKLYVVASALPLGS